MVEMIITLDRNRPVECFSQELQIGISRFRLGTRSSLEGTHMFCVDEVSIRGSKWAGEVGAKDITGRKNGKILPCFAG